MMTMNVLSYKIEPNIQNSTLDMHKIYYWLLRESGEKHVPVVIKNTRRNKKHVSLISRRLEGSL